MKKLFLGLMATVMFAFTGNAQEKLTPDAKSSLDAQMIILVRNANANVYSRGMSKTDFIKNAGPYTATENERQLLETVFKYLSTSATDADIMKADNGILSKTLSSGGFSASQSGAKWCWKCIGDWLLEAAAIILPLILHP